MSCTFCGRFFSRRFNLRRHENEYCLLRDQKSSYADMKRKRVESDDDTSQSSDDDQTRHSSKLTMKRERVESDDERSTTSNEDVSRPSDEDESSETDDMSDGEKEIDPWATLIDDAASVVRPDYKELLQTFIEDGQEEIAAKKKAFEKVLPQLQRELADVYLDNLRWIIALKRDPVHKKIMETRDAFVNEDDFDHDEALSAAIDKRKFLLKRLLENRQNNSNGSDESNVSE